MIYYRLLLLVFLVELSYSSLAQKSSHKIEKEPRSGFVTVFYPKEEGEKVKPYYIYSYEVSVGEYQSFMNYLKKEQEYDVLAKVQPDSTKWTFEDKVPFRDYFYSKKYLNYPIVCISYEAAVKYCKWIEKLINDSKKETRLAVVRLPTNLEWVNAVYMANQEAIYAGGNGKSLVNEKQCYLANFKANSEINMGVEGSLIPISKINSFNPSMVGTYNMSGNVAEMILSKGKIKGGHWNSVEEELKIVPVNSFDEPSVFVGFRPVMYYIENPD